MGKMDQMPMGEIRKDIVQGVQEYEKTKNTFDEEKYLEGLSEKDLLAEYDKHVDYIKQQRQDFEDYMEEERERGTDAGKSYIGDSRSDVDMIKLIQKILDERCVPYEKFIKE